MNTNKLKICILAIIITLFSYDISALAAIEQPVSFMQDDSRWGSASYSINNSSSTIATSGCGPTAMAMVLNYYIDESIDPLYTANYALENNHRTRNNGTSWTYFGDMADKYDLEFLQTSSSSEALKWMETKDDPLVICSMKRGLWTRRGHFILLWCVADGTAYINDPASTDQKRVQNSYNYMASQCKQYFCFNKIPQNDFVVETSSNLFLKSFILQGREVAISPLDKLENVGVNPTPTQMYMYWYERIAMPSLLVGNPNKHKS